MTSNAARVATFLKHHPEVYTWTLIEVGPHFTVECLPYFGHMKWEIQRMGGHAGMRESLDEALEEVLNQDENIVLPQDITRVL